MTGAALVAACVLGAAALPASGAAQERTGGWVELTAVYEHPDDSLLAHIVDAATGRVFFRGLAAGGGLDARAHYGWGRWSIGAGVRHTFHRVANRDVALHFTTVALEPRYTIPVGRVSLFASARAGLIWYRVASGGDEQSAAGRALGGGAGMILGSAATRLELGIEIVHALLGDPDVNGTVVPTPTGATDDGPMVSLRAGMVIPLGR